MTPSHAVEILRRGGLTLDLDEVRVEERGEAVAVRLPGFRLAWIPGDASGADHLAVENKVTAGGRSLEISVGPTGPCDELASAHDPAPTHMESFMPRRLDDDLTIRDVGEEDRNGLRDLWALTWSTTYGSAMGQEAVSEMIQALADFELSDMLPPRNEERAGVALRQGRIIGSAIMAERGRMAFLWGMYVHPDEQRRGVGTALMGHVADRLVEAASIEVRMLESSPWAEAFYRRCGFIEESREAMPLASGRPALPGIVMLAAPADVLRRIEKIAPVGG